MSAERYGYWKGDIPVDSLSRCFVDVIRVTLDSSVYFPTCLELGEENTRDKVLDDLF